MCTGRSKIQQLAMEMRWLFFGMCGGGPYVLLWDRWTELYGRGLDAFYPVADTKSAVRDHDGQRGVVSGDTKIAMNGYGGPRAVSRPA